MAQMPPGLPIDLLAQRIVSQLNIQNEVSGAAQQQRVLSMDEFRALRRQSTFMTQPFTLADTNPTLIRTREDRTYFLLMNTSGAAALYLGFDFQPNATNGVVLTAGGAYEPYQVPTNDLWITASVAGATGVLIYSVGNA